jgi:hypothetical protein
LMRVAVKRHMMPRVADTMGVSGPAARPIPGIRAGPPAPLLYSDEQLILFLRRRSKPRLLWSTHDCPKLAAVWQSHVSENQRAQTVRSGLLHNHHRQDPLNCTVSRCGRTRAPSSGTDAPEAVPRSRAATRGVTLSEKAGPFAAFRATKATSQVLHAVPRVRSSVTGVPAVAPRGRLSVPGAGSQKQRFRVSIQGFSRPRRGPGLTEPQGR